MLGKSKAVQKAVQIFIILLVLIALVVWKTIDSNKEVENKPVDIQQSLVECDYSAPCEFRAEKGAFWLSVQDPPIKAEQWINFSLQSELKNWRIIEAKIVGKSMFMGRIPVFFKTEKEGGFSAKTLVGACTSDKMVWTLQIQTEIDSQLTLLNFDFEVLR